MRTLPMLLIAAVATAGAPYAAAQSRRPQIVLTPTAPASVRAGATSQLSLAVSMPEAFHVQAHEPRDPALIPTTLEVQAPDGATVERIAYPEPKEFRLAGSDEVLLVYGPEFTIEVTLRVNADAAAGTLTVPAVLRYQACDDRVCFAPTRASTEWELRVEPAQ